MGFKLYISFYTQWVDETRVKIKDKKMFVFFILLSSIEAFSLAQRYQVTLENFEQDLGFNWK